MDAHERYEELAVGHVLGGLAASDAAEFRTHLLECRDCRLRVAELRDIAADLAAAEREERAEARVRTEVARRTAESDGETDPGPRTGVSSRLLGLVIVLGVVVLGGLAFWNLHLRTQVAATTALVERQDDALAELASGVSVAVDAAGSTSGMVVVDGDEVAFSFVDLPVLVGSERYVVWLTGIDGEEDEQVLVARTDDRRIAGAVEQAGASELLVTVADGPLGPDDPPARRIVRADLSAGVAAAR